MSQTYERKSLRELVVLYQRELRDIVMIYSTLEIACADYLFVLIASCMDMAPARFDDSTP